MAALRISLERRTTRQSHKHSSSRFTRLTTCAASLLLLSACGSKDESTSQLVTIVHPDDDAVPSIDRPLSAQLTRAALSEGLVSFDAHGRVVPALADRWIVADDGLSYIFRLRDGKWRGGEAISAKSAKAALEAAVRAQTGTLLGLDLNVLEEIKTMAGRVVEIRLRRPQPHFLQLLAQPEMGLMHEGKGNGPMMMEQREGLRRFSAIAPSKLGLPQGENWKSRTRSLDVMDLPAQQAVSRFNEGDADLVLGGRIADYPYTSVVGLLRGTIQIDPVIGLFGLQILRQEGFLAQARHREALALTIDRTALMAPFGISGWTPSTRIVAPALQGDLGFNGERWAEQSLEERRTDAASRVREWSLSQEKAADEKAIGANLRIWLPAGPGSDILFKKLAADFDAIGLALRRVNNLDEADLRLIDDVARYPRARWFLNRLSCAAKRGLCDREVDAIVARAARVVDESQRSALLGEAESRLTKANFFIPFGPPIRWSLVRGSVQGFAANPWGWHPLMPMTSKPK